MHAKGMTTRDIQASLHDIYGIDVSPSMISKIIDKVMGAVHNKVRSENRMVSKAEYISMALDLDGRKDILGIWIGDQEGAKFWLSVCNDLKIEV
jgi:putative transposase